MDWIKKNMVFVVSGVVALIAIGAAAYYLMVQMGKYDQAGTTLGGADTSLSGLVNKNPHPGAGNVDNIKAAKADVERLGKFKQDLTATFKSIPLGGDTEQAFKTELADMLAYIEREGKRTGLTTPTNFAMSFTAQKVGFRFASNSLPVLRPQLADLSEITRILVKARVNSIEQYRRVAATLDDKGPNAVEGEYVEKLKISTNEHTGAVVQPYLVTFRCFSEELGEVLEGIANSPYSIILKTVEVEPGQVRNIKPLFASAQEVFGAALGGPPGGPAAVYGPGSRPGENANVRGGGQMNSRYGGAGGGRDAQTSARYGGGGASRAGAQPPTVAPYVPGPPGSRPGGYGGAPAPVAPPQPTGPEVILTEEPLKVTLGIDVIRMPEAPAEKPAKN